MFSQQSVSVCRANELECSLCSYIQTKYPVC